MNMGANAGQYATDHGTNETTPHVLARSPGIIKRQGQGAKGEAPGELHPWRLTKSEALLKWWLFGLTWNLTSHEHAEVAELADALRSGRSDPCGHVGSTPTFGT